MPSHSGVSLPRLLAFGVLLCCAGASAEPPWARTPRTASPEDRGTRTPVADDVLIGRLELQWGDAAPGAASKHAFRVTLVEDNGVRHTLDAERALRAAGDVYALYARRVAVGVASETAKIGANDAAVVVPDAIVAIDDLVSRDTADPAGAAALKRAKTDDLTTNAEAITGPTAWVTLMCKFNDIATEQKTRSFFQSQYGNAIGQLGHYWQEVSYGQINLNGSDAYGWATLSQPRAYYITKDDAGKDKVDLIKLFSDCTAAHDANVNFSVNGGVQGVNMMFNGDLDGSAWGGTQCTQLDGLNRCWSTTWNPPWSFNNLAPLSHEMGHAYGLPHANNSDNDSDPYDNVWDVMSDSWNNASSHSTYGTLPKHINIYSRNRLGWVASARKLTVNAGKAATSVTLDRASLAGSTNRQMITLLYPGQSNRYFTIEVRKRSGDYESSLPGDAVVIHDVDTSRKDPSWSVDADTPPANRSNNEGSMFKVGETWISPDYAFRVKVESATAQGFVVSIKPSPVRAAPMPSRRSGAKPASTVSSRLTTTAAPRDVRRFANPERGR
jgi:M6 family metalloprotease-like protein